MKTILLILSFWSVQSLAGYVIQMPQPQAKPREPAYGQLFSKYKTKVSTITSKKSNASSLDQNRMAKVNDYFAHYDAVAAINLLNIAGKDGKVRMALLDYILERHLYSKTRFPLTSFAEVFIYASMIGDSNLLLNTLERADVYSFDSELSSLGRDGYYPTETDWLTYFFDYSALQYRNQYKNHPEGGSFNYALFISMYNVLEVIRQKTTPERLKIASVLRDPDLDNSVRNRAQQVIEESAKFGQGDTQKTAKELIRLGRWKNFTLKWCPAALSTLRPKGKNL